MSSSLFGDSDDNDFDDFDDFDSDTNNQIIDNKSSEDFSTFGKIIQTFPDLNGLYLLPSFIPHDIQCSLLNGIAENEYFAKTHSNQTLLKELEPGRDDQVMIFGDLPTWLNQFKVISNILLLLEKSKVNINTLHGGQALFNQCILNLYRPGQGLSHHIDLVTQFHDGIIVISLLSSIVMEFRRCCNGTQREILLRSGDVLFLSGEARYDWTHGISPRLDDDVEIDGHLHTIQRGIRISITIRKLIESTN